jgi:hypothetical protein
MMIKTVVYPSIDRDTKYKLLTNKQRQTFANSDRGKMQLKMAEICQSCQNLEKAIPSFSANWCRIIRRAQKGRRMAGSTAIHWPHPNEAAGLIGNAPINTI